MSFLSLNISKLSEAHGWELLTGKKATLPLSFAQMMLFSSPPRYTIDDAWLQRWTIAWAWVFSFLFSKKTSKRTAGGLLLSCGWVMTRSFVSHKCQTSPHQEERWLGGCPQGLHSISNEEVVLITPLLSPCHSPAFLWGEGVRVVLEHFPGS